MTTYSTSLASWMERNLVDAATQTYRVDHFVLVNDGTVRDGRSGNDLQQGTALGDLLWGNAGHDQQHAYGGNDVLNGGAGNDLLKGGAGNDRLEGWGDHDRIDGGDGADALYGGQGNDQLYGAAGSDFLCAGSGHDQLWGGAGRDTFVFRPDPAAQRSLSTYMDFNPAEDRLRIDGDLLPQGFTRSMIRVDADGDLSITVANGHRMEFATLDRTQIDALYAAIDII